MHWFFVLLALWSPHRTYLPVAAYGGPPRPTVGYAGSSAAMQNLAPPVTPSQDWSVDCDTPGQMPIIWGDSSYYVGDLLSLVIGRCNDGRGLLFLNEPALSEQADVTPERAADMLYQLLHAGWHGPVYAGGNIVELSEWEDRLINVYTSRYGSCDSLHPRCIEGLGGWHVHVYANLGGAGFGTAADIDPRHMDDYVAFSVARLREFISKRHAEGNPTYTIVSEAGLLVRQSEHAESVYPAMLATMDSLQRQLGDIPEVYRWLWYTTRSWRSPDNPEFNACCWWPDTDLVDANGMFTILGQHWRELTLP